MSTGSTKSLHFQGFNELANESSRSPRRSRRQPELHDSDSEQSAAAPNLNPLLAMGSLIRDHQLIAQKLKVLHLEEGAYHGSLQVVLTALHRMQTLVAVMIRQCEGD